MVRSEIASARLDYLESSGNITLGSGLLRHVLALIRPCHMSKMASQGRSEIRSRNNSNILSGEMDKQ
jgi:hypothetical protein